MASPTQPDAGWMEQAETVLGRKLTSIDLVGGIYCTICQSTFSNKKEYDIHYVDHEIGDADIGYTCVVCRKQFTGYPSFRNHCYLAHVAKNKHKWVLKTCSLDFFVQNIVMLKIKNLNQWMILTVWFMPTTLELVGSLFSLCWLLAAQKIIQYFICISIFMKKEKLFVIQYL